jgi:hypothetical protein
MPTTDVDDFLAHYGVPGMKWGHRRAARVEAKAAKKAARAEEDRQIVGARIRQEKRAANLNNKAAATYTATTKKGQKAAEEAYARAEKKLVNNPDAITAARMTSGEKAVNRVAMGVTIAALGLSIAPAAIAFALDR